MVGTAELVSRALPYLRKFDWMWMEFLQWLNNFEFIADFLYVAHSDPFNIPYELLISVFEQMFSRIPKKYSAKYRFNYRNQLLGETAKHYANSLEKLLNRCSSDINTKVNLVNRFINGLIDMDAKSELLKRKRDITLDEALTIAQVFESKEWKYKLEINSNGKKKTIYTNNCKH
ncbi:hypothetical protein M0804_013287 [Polistes exclamans]|nr:hypothetical protein M0804_013287 [Polistes exclamans]